MLILRLHNAHTSLALFYLFNFAHIGLPMMYPRAEITTMTTIITIPICRMSARKDESKNITVIITIILKYYNNYVHDY